MVVKSRFFWAIIMLIFLIRGMIPVGFMPDFSGKHTIQICSGTEIKTITVSDDGTPIPADHKKTVCSYSFLSATFYESPVYVPAIESPALIAVDTSPTILALDTHRFLLSPPSRAPPSLNA